MRKFIKPVVVLSSCLGGINCRWDGERIDSDMVNHLKSSVTFILVCPEVEIGLSTPRERVQVESYPEGHRLVFAKSKVNLTDKLNRFSKKFIRAHADADGFIMKDRSPSCGLDKAKLYSGSVGSPLVGRTKGMFARAIMDALPDTPITTEGFLLDQGERDRFLTQIHTCANFRVARKTCTEASLAKFHEANYWLFETFSRRRLVQMNTWIKRGYGSKSSEWDIYEQTLLTMMSTSARTNSIESAARLRLNDPALGFSAGEIKKGNLLADQVRLEKIDKVSFRTQLRVIFARVPAAALQDRSYLEPYPLKLENIG